MLEDVIVFPVIDWSFQRQRPQQIAIELGRRGHRVFYLTEKFAPSDLPRPYLFWSSPAENVYIVQLRCPEPHPNIYKALPTAKCAAALIDAITALRTNCRITQAISIIDLPFWRQIVSAHKASGDVVVYDCMDYHAGFKNNEPHMLAEEGRLIKEADLVVTTSASLSEQIARLRPNMLLRNGCEASHFVPCAGRKVHRLSERPVVGYFGVLDHWFDVKLVTKAARAFRDWHFVLIGRRQDCNLDPLGPLANVQIISEVPYEVLPQFTLGFDVCIIPFVVNDLTLHTNPVKMYEYLAAGKPVVGTAMPEIMIGEEGLVYVAKDADDFICKLSDAMAKHDDPVYSERRIAYAMNATWTDRVDRLELAITELSRRDRNNGRSIAAGS